MFCGKVVLRNFVKFIGKLLCQSLFFNKVAGWGTIQELTGSLESECEVTLNWFSENKIVKIVDCKCGKVSGNYDG